MRKGGGKQIDKSAVKLNQRVTKITQALLFGFFVLFVMAVTHAGKQASQAHGIIIDKVRLYKHLRIQCSVVSRIVF